MHTVTLEEAQAHLPELVAEAAKGGEIIITQGDQPMAKLAAAPEKRWAAFGMLKGQIEIAPDFDEPLEEFKPYME